MQWLRTYQNHKYLAVIPIKTITAIYSVYLNIYVLNSQPLGNFFYIL